MRKYFQFAALLVVTMLSACSGGTESKEAADTAMEDKPVVRLASVTSRDVDQIEEYTATVEAEAKNNIAPTSPGRIDRIFVEVGDHVSKGQKLVQMDAANLKAHYFISNRYWTSNYELVKEMVSQSEGCRLL